MCGAMLHFSHLLSMVYEGDFTFTFNKIPAANIHKQQFRKKKEARF
jgi:hypothetical protein